MQTEIISLYQLGLKVGGKPILENIEHTIYAGECVALIGANGSGKTTLLKAIAGIIRPQKGQLCVNGLYYKNQVHAIQIKSILGYAPDHPPVYANDTVLSYLRFIGQLKRIPKALIDSNIEESLATFELETKRHSLLHTLSKGTLQRVNLAQASINKPKILLLDEPTNALDADQCANLVKFLKLLRTQGTTIIIASHHYTEVVPICDYMLKLAAGSLQKIFTPLTAQEILQTNDQLNYTT